MTAIQFRRALISVHNKDGLIELARQLSATGCEIVASGGTARTLAAANINVSLVEDVTGAAEILEGRVKTLHPAIHGGILANLDSPNHKDDLERLGVKPIDLVIVNLYPFESTLAKAAPEDELVEEIDIGGVALLRAAAKNFKYVTVICDVNQYPELMNRLDRGFNEAERRQLAAQVFTRTHEYDGAITQWLDGNYQSMSAEKVAELRYGENPHQTAALYSFRDALGITSAEQLSGKAMSFNNYLDADAALRLASDLNDPTIAIIKHTNPCGVASAETLHEAYVNAFKCDPISAFGGVVASNRKVTGDVAAEIIKVFTEVVIAPEFDNEALDILRTNSNLRILRIQSPTHNRREIRPISGGFLTQSRDSYDQLGDHPSGWTLVAGSAANQNDLRDLEFAWRSIRSVRSNAILIAKNCASIGIGMGQVNRLNSARLAVAAAGELARGAVAASDAFFPFSDGLQVLINAGITAVVQPGGSKRDAEVIAAANAAGITMYFTGVRHFSHS